MTKILVFTDLHMLPEGKRIIGLDPEERLRPGLAHAARMHPDADRVILTGDLTHYGDDASYQRLRRVLADFPLPVSITIGNHDDRRTFIRHFPEESLDENGFVQRIIDFEDMRAVILDTNLGVERGHPDHAGGVLCEKRLAWLDQQLAAAADRPVVIFMHHPPHDTGFKGMDAIKLSNGEAFHDLIARHGNVRQIVAGHVHRTISGSHRGVPFAVFKSPLHQQPTPFEVEDTHTSVDEPGAYGILITTAQGLLVHTEDYDIAESARRAVDKA